MFIPTDVDSIRLYNLLEGEFPYVNVYRSTLGGENRASLIVKVSLDSRETWKNGIFQNSRYSIFHVHQNKIEQFSLYGVTKFRKCKAENIADVYQKLMNWKAKNS